MTDISAIYRPKELLIAATSPPFVFIVQVPIPVPQPEHYEAKVVEVHKAKAGYTPAQAEAEFLQVAKKLPRYGTHLFGAQVSGRGHLV